MQSARVEHFFSFQGTRMEHVILFLLTVQTDFGWAGPGHTNFLGEERDKYILPPKLPALGYLSPQTIFWYSYHTKLIEPD